MRNTPLCSRLSRGLIVCAALAAAAADPQPPQGFTALFNGKDLSGWHGMPSKIDPYKLAAMSGDQRKASIEKWNEDFRQHWKVDNGEIVGRLATDGSAVNSIIAAGTGVIAQTGSHNMFDPKYRNCTACHVRIHGSNADPNFLR